MYVQVHLVSGPRRNACLTISFKTTMNYKNLIRINEQFQSQYTSNRGKKCSVYYNKDIKGTFTTILSPTLSSISIFSKQ